MTEISQWGGLATNASPYSLPPGGMVEQINLQCLSPGKLNTRRGLSMTDLQNNSPVIRVFLYHANNQATVVYQRENGEVYTQ